MSAIGPQQLGRLYDDHAAALVLYARQRCDAQSAEDAVHEAFIALARQRRAPDQVVGWLYRTVRNAAISASRSAHRRRRREGRASASEAWFESFDDRLDAQTAARVLAELDPETREIIVARLWGALNFEEAARLQGCSLATAHRRYHDGLARLQERLDQPWQTTLPAENRT